MAMFEKLLIRLTVFALPDFPNNDAQRRPPMSGFGRDKEPCKCLRARLNCSKNEFDLKPWRRS
jgi:hypothetical protein